MSWRAESPSRGLHISRGLPQQVQAASHFMRLWRIRAGNYWEDQSTIMIRMIATNWAKTRMRISLLE
jgi:hypothetical protein